MLKSAPAGQGLEESHEKQTCIDIYMVFYILEPVYNGSRAQYHPEKVSTIQFVQRPCKYP